MKRIAYVLMMWVMLWGLMLFPVYGGEERPEYLVTGQEKDGTMEVTVYIDKAKMLAGRLALTYDDALLTLLKTDGSEARNGDALTAVIEKSGDVVLTTESLKNSDLVRPDEGKLLFVWYANTSDGKLDASAGRQKIGGFTFRLASGALDKLTSDSLKVWDIEENQLKGWESGAAVSLSGTDYKIDIYTYQGARAGSLKVGFDYPGSDIVPIYMRTIEVTLADSQGTGIGGGTILADGREYTTNASGTSSVELVDGTYNLRAWAEGYEAREERLTVDGDAAKTITLRSDVQLCNEAAGALAITYAKGDSAGSVTTHVTLPSKGLGDTAVTWKSSDRNVMTEKGAVIPNARDTKVTLTATVSKGKASAERAFSLTIKGKGQNASGMGNSGDSNDGPNDPEMVGNGVFTDLTGYGWAEEAILQLTEQGVIAGTGNQQFSPGVQIKRADLLTMLDRMLDFESIPKEKVPSTESLSNQTITGDDGTITDGNPSVAQFKSFADVPGDSYYFRSVEQARLLGIANGDGTNFYPERSILRQDVMVLASKALERKRQTEFTLESGTLDSFTDNARVSSYAETSVSKMVAAGYITGNDKRELQPLNGLTRAEAAVFLYNIQRQGGGR